MDIIFIQPWVNTALRRQNLTEGRIYRALAHKIGYVVLFGTPHEMPNNVRRHDNNEARDAVLNVLSPGAVQHRDFKHYLLDSEAAGPCTEVEFMAQAHLTAEDLALTRLLPRGLIA